MFRQMQIGSRVIFEPDVRPDYERPRGAWSSNMILDAEA